MRGCLSVLFLGAAFLSALIWFGGPPIASAVVAASLTGSGLEADDLEVSVRADPPFTLAVGQADDVSITGENVQWNDLRADSLSVTLTDVDLFGRTAERASGFIDGVEINSADGDLATGSLVFDGPAEAADATVRLDGSTVERLATAAFEREFGTRPDEVTLVEPDIVRVRTAAGSVDSRLEIEGGALAIRSILGVVRLVEPGPSTPISLTGVEIADGGLELTGTIDLAALLG